MLTPELTDYIQKSRAGGQSDQIIKQSLLQAGWQEAQVNEGLGGVTINHSSMGWFWVVGGAVILIGGGLIYYNYFSTPTETITENKEVTNQVAEQTTINNEIENNAAARSNQVVTPDPTKTIGTNCGKAGSVHLQNNAIYSSSPETQQAYECFVENFKRCDKATVQVALDARNPENYLNFSVDFGSAAGCSVSGPRVNIFTGEMSNGSCLISSQWLDQYYIDSQKNNSTMNADYLKGYLLANAVLMGSKTEVTLSNGTVVKPTCN